MDNSNSQEGSGGFDWVNFFHHRTNADPSIPRLCNSGTEELRDFGVGAILDCQFSGKWGEGLWSGEGYFFKLVEDIC